MPRLIVPDNAKVAERAASPLKIPPWSWPR